jgi:hypothetical protein
MISDFVVPKAVRYRGSLATFPTLTVFRVEIAEPVRPLVIGKVRNSGAPGPLQTMFDTSPAA